MEQSREYYCYLHIRRSDGRVFYVGKGRRKRAWRLDGRNPHWRATAKKHGLVVEVLEDASGLTEREAHRVERELIAHHRYHGAPLVNATDGGEGSSGYVPSEEARRKIGDAHRGVPRSEETRRKLSEALCGKPQPWRQGDKHPMFGRTGDQHHNYKSEILTFESIATGERFELTRLQAVERLGIPGTKISGLIAGRRPTAKGYRLIR